STPVYFFRFHSPAFSEVLPAPKYRAEPRMWAIVSSAAEMMFDVGALTTTTPAEVAAGTSTLSRPTPARAITLTFFAAAMAPAPTRVAGRASNATASQAAGRGR